jgi:Thioredoxin
MKKTKKQMKKYTKSSDREEVKKELSKDVPMIIRIYRETCPACQMSEKPWKEFCEKQAPQGFSIVEIEEEAMPLEMMNGIQGFPTYAIHDENGENRHHTGALMNPSEIEDFVTDIETDQEE